jgi:hypothetical protein
MLSVVAPCLHDGENRYKLGFSKFKNIFFVLQNALA